MKMESTTHWFYHNQYNIEITRWRTKSYQLIRSKTTRSKIFHIHFEIFNRTRLSDPDTFSKILDSLGGENTSFANYFGPARRLYTYWWDFIFLTYLSSQNYGKKINKQGIKWSKNRIITEAMCRNQLFSWLNNSFAFISWQGLQVLATRFSMIFIRPKWPVYYLCRWNVIYAHCCSQLNWIRYTIKKYINHPSHTQTRKTKTIKNRINRWH